MLEWRDDLPPPDPGPGQVRVRVAAASVNNTDINTRVGWYSKSGDPAEAAWTGRGLTFPHVQGIDGCGTIEGVGPGVDPGRIGQRVLIDPFFRTWRGEALAVQRVMGSETWGSFAEFVVIDAPQAHPIHSALSDAELATFPCAYGTALNMILRARIAPGERVLVTGASGGVGGAAVAILAAIGARAVAVTTPGKAEAIRELGAGEVIGRDDAPPGDLDAALDLVGGGGWARLIGALRPFGRLAVAGAVAGPVVPLDLRDLYLKDLTLLGCTQQSAETFPRLIEMIEGGTLRPNLAVTYPLREIGAAQAAFAAKDHVGKIALSVAGSGPPPGRKTVGRG